ncbi:MAG TPA: DUF2231 domain-containing protein [Verrucomicrobiae bacterium]|nr:DUF2231 domain-containing protein [Verrucomicrobiae bacterium]
MNVFDPKSALLAKHAQHVVLVHFPIALTIMSFAFDVLAVWRRKAALAAAAFYNLAGAAITSVPTVATGLLAWQWQLAGARLKGVLRLHLVFAVTSMALIWFLWAMRWRDRKQSVQSPGPLYFVLGLITLVMIALTGHLGGFLSGVNVAGD